MKVFGIIVFIIVTTYLGAITTGLDLGVCKNCSVCAEGLSSNNSNPDCTCCPRNGSCKSEAMCLPCLPGTYNDERGSEVCKECSEGFFSRKLASRKCQPCSPGEFQNETGSTDCLQCPPGSYCPSLNCSSCLPCPPGSVSNEPGQAKCNLCPSGTMSDKSGLTTCKVCAPGSAARGPGARECTVCQPGWYTSFPRFPTCLPCSPGSYCSTKGCTKCQLCPPGMDLPVRNSTINNCEACPPGTYAPNSGTGICLICPSGYYNFKSNATICLECPQRFYCPTPTEMRSCPVGSTCPPGTSEPYQCHGPVWKIKVEEQICELSGEFIGVIVGSIGSALFIVLVCAFVIYKRVSTGEVQEEAIANDSQDERNPLLSERRRGTMQIMYTGV